MNGGIIGWVGTYIVFIAGVAGWGFSDLYKFEKISTIGILALAGCAQAIVSFQEHPFLASSTIFITGNILLNIPYDTQQYEKFGRKYWPGSSTILPIGLLTGVVCLPLAFVIIPDPLKSWIGDSESKNTQKGSEVYKNKKLSDEPSTPRSEFKKVQQSQQTAEDINTRRPNDGES